MYIHTTKTHSLIINSFQVINTQISRHFNSILYVKFHISKIWYTFRIFLVCVVLWKRENAFSRFVFSKAKHVYIFHFSLFRSKKARALILWVYEKKRNECALFKFNSNLFSTLYKKFLTFLPARVLFFLKNFLKLPFCC
jgi:hypothetical protein